MTDELSDIAKIAKDLLDSWDGDPALTQRLTEVLPALREAAESGDIGAQNVLGGVLLEVEEDPSAAARWFERTSAAGSAVGKRSLGHLYANGLGVPQDTARAEALLQAAADGGDAYARFNLVQLRWGQGDPREAVAHLRAAGEGGVEEAYAPLGDLLAALGDDAGALRAYGEGAARGDTTAMHMTARWLRDGTAGAPDREAALVWFFRMLGEGDADGVHEAIEMAKSMTDEQIRRAGERAGRTAEAEAMIGTVRRNG